MTMPPTILCVDDQLSGLEGRTMLFEQHGYNVLSANNGMDALRLFAARSIDLVVLDYRMPPMNGDVVALRMKAERPDVPITILSGDDELPDGTLKVLDAFISKSEPPAKLLAVIQDLLDLHRPLSLKTAEMNDDDERVA